MSLLLYPWGKSPRYPLARRLGGPQSRSGQHGEKKILDPTGTRTPTPQLSSPWLVTIPAHIRDLYRGINEFKRGYLPRSNLVKDENGGDACRFPQHF
jgi:hypothetical protein